MAATAIREEHVRFWKFLAGRLKEHGNIVWALNEATEEMAGTTFGEALARMAGAVESGKPIRLTAAAEPDLFSETAIMLLWAGEDGGHMAEVVERIADGAKDGSLPLPGLLAEGDEQVRYWRCFGRMIGAGVPILEAFRVVREEICTTRLADATRAIEQSVLRGSAIATVMREYRDLFPHNMCFAVGIGEDTGDLDERAMQIADALQSGDLDALVADLTDNLPPMDQIPAVRRFVNILILNAIQAKASDVHVEPTENKCGRFRLRLDGVLHDYDQPREGLRPGEEVPYDEVINRIKVMAGMDLTEKRAPQDGRIELNISGAPVDVRVCAVPTVHGERIAMRILDRRTVHLKLGEIGLLGDDLETIRGLCRLPHGTVLVAGPTGSGKTTLLYGMLMELDRDHRCVVSVEDPVEYYLEGVAQVNVNPQVGRTFPTVVRSVLRQDPDVILIGELRDSEMVNLAAQCALTGHLVFTTVHAATAPGGVRRLLDMGLAPFVLNASLAAVISQRLVRILCPDCKQPFDPSPNSLPREAAERLDGREDAQFHRPVGCQKCRGTGYRGRDCINEILIPDDRVKELVSAEAPAREIRDAAVAAGMRTMLSCGIERAARGTTSIEEVLRVVGANPEI